MGRVIAVGVPVVLLAILLGCGDGSKSSLTPGLAQAINPLSSVEGAFAIAPPAVVLASAPARCVSAQELEHSGSEYDAGFAQRAAVEDASVRLSPAWLSGASGFDTLAYALYRFNLQNYKGNQTLTLTWGEAPQDAAKLWVGFSHWAGACWDWRQLYEGKSLDLGLDGFAPYTISATGEMLAVVVLLGESQALLTQLRIGDEPFVDYWPVFGHDARHTRLSPCVGAQTNNVKWSCPMNDAIWSSPAVGADGTLYVGCHDNNLYAISADGRTEWFYVTGGHVSSSPVVASDGTVYVGSGDKTFYAINPDGSTKWFYLAGDYIDSSPTIGPDGTAYVGSRDDKLYALHPDGSLKWAYATGDDISSSPAIDSDGIVYVGSHDMKLYAINLDGSLKWSFATEAYIASSPAIGGDGTVYVGSSDNSLYAVNPDGSEKWSFATGGQVRSSPAIGLDGTLYFGSCDKSVYAVNPDGSLKWSLALGDVIWSSAAVGADSTIYIGCNDCNIYAINADGSQKWMLPTGDMVASCPAIGIDGTVYMGSDDGKLRAFGD